MSLFSFLPQRCLTCGAPSDGPLCRPCLARFQPTPSSDRGLGPCPVCGQVRLAEAQLCVDCSAQAWSFPSLDGLFGYQDSGAEILRLYKFSGLIPLARAWAPTLAVRLHPPGPLVPVPPLKRHLRRRGWDPVQTLTRAVASVTGFPVWNILRRRRSRSQKTLSGPERFLNADRSYHIVRRAFIPGTPLVWLLDDVVTTGATVEACSRLLLEAGVAEVRVVSLGLH